jgi:cell division protein FtsW
MALVLVAGALLLLQPDYGAVAVLAATAVGMLFLAGARYWQFAALALGALGLLAGLAVSESYRFERLTTFLDPWQDAFGSGYQLTQALIAVGSGSWFGVGLGNSVQKLLFLPEAHNDFLFAVLGEELGLAGIVTVVALYGFLLWRCFGIAAAADRKGLGFGAYLAYGVGLWIGLQAFVNMGVNLGMLPTKGLTLPLMSAGGSSLVVSCLAVGLLLRVHREAQEAAVLPERPRRGRRS